MCDENSETSIYDDLPSVENGLIDIILVDVNLVFSTVEVEDLRLDGAVDTEDVDVNSEVETTVIEVDVNSVFSSVKGLRLDEAVDSWDVDVASEIETAVIVVGLCDEISETSICDYLPTVEEMGWWISY